MNGVPTWLPDDEYDNQGNRIVPQVVEVSMFIRNLLYLLGCRDVIRNHNYVVLPRGTLYHTLTRLPIQRFIEIVGLRLFS